MRKKGFVILTVLFVAAGVSILVGAFSLSVMYNNQMMYRRMNTIKGYYLAYSGMRFARYSDMSGETKTVYICGSKVSINRPGPTHGSIYDLNADGYVNNADLVDIRENYYSNRMEFDVNRDYKITVSDYAFVRNAAGNFGKNAPGDYFSTISAAAEFNGVTVSVKAVQDVTDFSKKFLYRSPIVKWE